MKETIMFKEINEQIERIMPCYEYNKDALEQISEIIKEFDPTHIMIVARGTSMHSGVYAKYQLERYLKIPVSIAYPSVSTVYDTKFNFTRTIVLAISQSGKGLDILDVVKDANERGALTIAITNELESLLAKEAKYHLYCNANKAVSYAATKTFTLTMYLINKLIYSITKNNDIKIEEDKLISSLKAGLSYQDKLHELALKFKNAEHTFVLARGYTLALAMETALKMKETSHYDVNAYPISEFFHGPIAMTSEKTPLIVLSIDDITNHNTKEFFEKIKNINVYKLLITNDKALNEYADDAILIEEQNSLYRVFITIIIIQLFAGELSTLRGINPDYLEILHGIKTI